MVFSRFGILRALLIALLALGALFAAAPSSAQDLSCTATQLEGASVTQDYRDELSRAVLESGLEAGYENQHITPLLNAEKMDLRDVLIRLAVLEKDRPSPRERMAWDRAVSYFRSQVQLAHRDSSELTKLYLRLAELKQLSEDCLRQPPRNEGLTQRFEKPIATGTESVERATTGTAGTKRIAN